MEGNLNMDSWDINNVSTIYAVTGDFNNGILIGGKEISINVDKFQSQVLINYATAPTGQTDLSLIHRSYADSRYLGISSTHNISANTTNAPNNTLIISNGTNLAASGVLITDVLTTSSTITIGDIDGLTTALTNKQDTLVSGTNIRTIDGESLLQSGNTKTQWANAATATHTGDLVETELDSFIIPANTYKQGDIIELSVMFARNGATTANDTYIVRLNDGGGSITMTQQILGGGNRGLRGSVGMYIKTASGANNINHWTVNQVNQFITNTSFPRTTTIDFTQPITVKTYATLGDVTNSMTMIYTCISKK
jgi:hypothetical protein